MANMKTKFEVFIEDAERRRLFEQESLAFEATELISTLMEEQKVKKADLARRIGKSKAYVTQLLSGSRNMTLHTFADLAFALGHKVELGVSPVQQAARRPVVQRYQFWRHPGFVVSSTETTDEISWAPILALDANEIGETAHAA